MKMFQNIVKSNEVCIYCRSISSQQITESRNVLIKFSHTHKDGQNLYQAIDRIHPIITLFSFGSDNGQGAHPIIQVEF